MKLSETDIEIIERDNHIPPEKSILTKERRINMTVDQRKLFAEILQKELDKIFEKHIEDLKNTKVVEEGGLSNYAERPVSEVHRS